MASSSVPARPHDLQVRLLRDDQRQPLQDDSVVVDAQDARAEHGQRGRHATAPAGTRIGTTTSICVPAPGTLWSAKRPPICSVRSRMLTSPRCPVALVSHRARCQKPQPSSEITGSVTVVAS